MQAVMDIMKDKVLNDERVVAHAFRKLSLPTLLGLLGRCCINLMVIGKKQSWIINARTSHRRHYIGTKQKIGLAEKTVKEQLWSRLETFALRYASAGSIVKVFCSHQESKTAS